MQIAEFIQQSIERAGGAVDMRAPGLLEALLPPSLESTAGGRSLLPVALDPLALSADPEAELATVGSAFLDSLIAFVSEHGTTSTGHILVEHPRKKGMREEVQKHLVFTNGRVRFPDEDPQVKLCHYAQFNFKVTFLSEERRERLFAVPVNLWSNSANLLLMQRLSPAILEDAAPDLPPVSRVPIDEAFAIAQEALRRLVYEETTRHQERIQKRFFVEYSRIRDYYVQVAKEIERRKQKETDPQKIAPLEQKVAAAENERERKLRELGETYRLRQRARLTSVQILSQPKTFFNVFIDRGQVTRQITLAYDSLLDRLEPPICEKCREEMTRIHVTPEGELLCPKCAGK